jgi:hypothetical protein
MRYIDLEKEIGVHRLVIAKKRKRLFPESSGEISPEEARILTEELVGITGPKTIKLRVIFASDKFPRFVEATDKKGEERFTVMIPSGYKPKNFLGREILVEKRRAADDRWTYQFNPWNDE